MVRCFLWQCNSLNCVVEYLEFVELGRGAFTGCLHIKVHKFPVDFQDRYFKNKTHKLRDKKTTEHKFHIIIGQHLNRF